MTPQEVIKTQLDRARMAAQHGGMSDLSPESAPRLLSVEERRALGHAKRAALSRSAHAEWQAALNRDDPVDLLRAGEAGRLPSLLPLRYGRMAVDPFAFFRGAAAVMAADLGAMPNTGLRTQLCGDAHLANFGAMCGLSGEALFDVNDFDETLPGPFEWDIKRLAASMVVAGQVLDLSDKACRALARRATHAYRREINDLAGVPPFEAWNARVRLEDAVEEIGDRDVRKRERHRLQMVLQASQDGYRHLIAGNTTLRLPERPPAIFRLGQHEAVAHAAFASYAAHAPAEMRALLDCYRLRDVAFKAVGVGSVGTFCAIGLFATADGDTLLLQLKQALRSVLAPYAGESAYAHAGQRVVVGQRMLQAEPDVFLGFTDYADRQFYVRRLKDPRVAVIGAEIEASALPYTARLCGRTLARAHSRAGDAALISGYLGDGDSFDEAVAQFALTYADQTQRDHARLVQAIADGQIEAVKERS